MEDVEVYIMKEDIEKSLNEASVQEYTDPLVNSKANKLRAKRILDSGLTRENSSY